MDPQRASVAIVSGGPRNPDRSLAEARPNLSNLLIDDEPPPTLQLVVRSPLPRLLEENQRFDIIVTNKTDMTRIERELVTAMDSSRRLLYALQPIIPLYRYIILDCPPNLGLLTENALAAATHILVPVKPEGLSTIEPLADVEAMKNRARRFYNPNLEIVGLVPNQVMPQRSEQLQILEVLTKKYGDKVLPYIKNLTEVSEANTNGYDIFSYKPPRNLAETYVSANVAAQQFMLLAEKLVAALEAGDHKKTDANRISARGQR
jgi:chromosome partitioning protein